MQAPVAKPRQRTATACGALISAFAAISSLSTNIFLPSLPAIAANLRVSSAAVTSTITVFPAIVAVGQLIAGPLSGWLGRRMPILIGLCIFVLGAMRCGFAGDFDGLAVCGRCLPCVRRRGVAPRLSTRFGLYRATLIGLVTASAGGAALLLARNSLPPSSPPIQR